MRCSRPIAGGSTIWPRMPRIGSSRCLLNCPQRSARCARPSTGPRCRCRSRRCTRASSGRRWRSRTRWPAPPRMPARPMPDWPPARWRTCARCARRASCPAISLPAPCPRAFPRSPPPSASSRRARCWCRWPAICPRRACKPFSMARASKPPLSRRRTSRGRHAPAPSRGWCRRSPSRPCTQAPRCSGRSTRTSRRPPSMRWPTSSIPRARPARPRAWRSRTARPATRWKLSTRCWA